MLSSPLAEAPGIAVVNMKRKAIGSRRAAALATITLLLLSMGGCCMVTVQGYPGASHPASELATLWVPEVKIDSVDGLQLSMDSGIRRKTKATVTPGHHSLMVTARIFSAFRKSVYQSDETELVAMPGHVYYLFIDRQGMHSHLRIRDLGTDYKPPTAPLLFGGDEYRNALTTAKSLGLDLSSIDTH